MEKVKFDADMKEDKQRKALLELCDLYSNKEPLLVVNHVDFVIMREAVRLLREHNEHLIETISKLKAPSEKNA